MGLKSQNIREYHIFLASPGDMNEERQAVRDFFEEYNRTTASQWQVRFTVIDWENYSTIGVGRPQQLISQQTLEKYSDSLALVVGLMGQRFGSPTGTNESGTEEEFEWALNSYLNTGFPEIKWFFRKVEKFTSDKTEPEKIQEDLEQWKKVQEFTERLRHGTPDQPQLLYGEFKDIANFRDVFRRDLSLWLADPKRPWTPNLESLMSHRGQEERIQEMLKGLSRRIADIKIIYRPVALNLKKMAKEGVSEEGELLLDAVEGFLSDESPAEEFRNIWEIWEATISTSVQRENPKYEVLAQRFNHGEIIPVLGTELHYILGLTELSSKDLTHRLADQAEYKNFAGSLPMISQYYQMTEYGRRMLLSTLKDTVELKLDSLRSTPFHQMLAKAKVPMLVISVYYDRLLEIQVE